MKNDFFDVLIIGCGITGSLLARELSRYDLNIAALDKENDVGNQTTNANSAIIHSGYDPVPGTLKAKLNVLGNKMYDQLASELDVDFYRIGSLTVALYDEQLPLLEALKERSAQNGVEVQLLTPEQVKEMEPNINPCVKGALYAPTAGIIDPFNLSVHAMENAMDNGVELFLNEEVIDIKYENEIFIVYTKNNQYKAKVVVNAAGNYADKIAEMIEPIDWKITPRKGEYFVLDHFKPALVNKVIFPLPSEKGKGILVSQTTSGNYIVGPSSEEIFDKDDYSTDKPTLDNIRKQASDMVPNIPFNQVIRTFSGLRPTCTRHDFVIESAKSNNHFIILGGIESPGLASSPAIAKYTIDNLIRPILDLKEKESFDPYVKKYIRTNRLTIEERDALIKENSDYGKIICDCEKISLGEIKDALSRNCPPHSVKALKRRTRAGYGKCQGGFCSPRVVLLLAKHYGISPLDVPYDSLESKILLKKIKEDN